MNFRRALTVLCVSALLLSSTSCNQRKGSRIYNPAEVAFKASYTSLFDGIHYPSMVLALANYTGNNQQELFSVSVTSPANDAVLRVVVDSTNLNYVSIIQEVLPKKGSTYTFSPHIKWKFDKLYNLRQQGAVDFTFTCYINDEEVDVKNIRLNYRSVNDCLLSVSDTSKRTYDFRWLFLGYVNEDHPYIDSILTTILSQGNITTFAGYQKNRQHVTDQVFAIWYYALNRGITYSSISCTANPSVRSVTQHIRFFDEVYNSRQANCIDACVFFASIMRKIGLRPVILVEPCHAYLGYYTGKGKTAPLALLETTATAWVNFPELQRSLTPDGKLPPQQFQKVAGYLTKAQIKAWNEGTMTFDELKHAVALSTFKLASDYRKADYQNNKAYFADTNQLRYQMFDVTELRKMVQPISAR